MPDRRINYDLQSQMCALYNPPVGPIHYGQDAASDEVMNAMVKRAIAVLRCIADDEVYSPENREQCRLQADELERELNGND